MGELSSCQQTIGNKHNRQLNQLPRPVHSVVPPCSIPEVSRLPCHSQSQLGRDKFFAILPFISPGNTMSLKGKQPVQINRLACDS
jgi:hypothetical protein